MIAFVLENTPARFAVDTRGMNPPGLTIGSPQLLRVARPFDGMMTP